MLHLNLIKKSNIRDKKILHMENFKIVYIVYIETMKTGGKVRATDRFSRQKFALVVRPIFF